MAKSSYGKGNQNVTPGWASWSQRKDGKESIVYGKTGQDKPHGHTVRDKDGRLDFSRSISGKKKYDSGK